jgi:hypothetical protein
MTKVVLIGLIIFLAAVPFSSRWPDPVQRVLHLEGGAGEPMKLFLGFAVIGVIFLIAKFAIAKRRRSV